MSVIGRPTSYRPEFCELACNYCLLGATNAELAGFFDVAPRTIDNWIARIPEFAAAVREGRAVANSRVAHALYQRAVGYDSTVQRTVLWRGEERTLTRTVHHPPDIRACIFWLSNRRRQDWCKILGRRSSTNRRAGTGGRRGTRLATLTATRRTTRKRRAGRWWNATSQPARKVLTASSRRNR